MRIAQLVSPAGHNGVATSCLALIDGELRAGHELLVVSPPNSWLGRQQLARPCERLTSEFETRPKEIRRIGNALREWRPDVIHCHGSRANKYGLIFRLVAHIPVVATAHAKHIQLPWMLFSALIAPSLQTAAYHIRYNLVSRRRIHIIPNFVDLSRILGVDVSQRAALRESFGASDADFVIGVVGKISRLKNQAAALVILRDLAASDPNVKMVLVGRVPQGAEPMPGWTALVNDPLIRPRLVMTGHREDVLTVMTAFDALLCVSNKEVGPMVVLEAMAMSLPVVSYRVGLVPEVIEDGVDGFSVVGGDVEAAAACLAELRADPARARAMGARARAKIDAGYTGHSLVKRVEAVYRTVASHPRPAGPGSRSA